MEEVGFETDHFGIVVNHVDDTHVCFQIHRLMHAEQSVHLAYSRLVDASHMVEDDPYRFCCDSELFWCDEQLAHSLSEGGVGL